MSSLSRKNSSRFLTSDKRNEAESSTRSGFIIVREDWTKQMEDRIIECMDQRQKMIDKNTVDKIIYDLEKRERNKDADATFPSLTSNIPSSRGSTQIHSPTNPNH